MQCIHFCLISELHTDEKSASCSTILISSYTAWYNHYLCIKALRRSFVLTSSTLVIVEGGVKQSHWITIAFGRLCSRCCSATSDSLSYLPTLISRDLDKTLFKQFVRSRITYSKIKLHSSYPKSKVVSRRNRKTSQQFLQNFLSSCPQGKIVNTP